MTNSDALKARVLAAAAATPATTRPAGNLRLAILLGVSLGLAVALFLAMGGLEHSAGRPATITLAITGGWAMFSAVLSWTVLARGRSTLSRPPIILLGFALATPVVLMGWMHHFYGSYTEPFQRLGLRCLVLTLAMAALPLGSFLALRRGIEPRGPWALGAAIGAVCGAWANVLVDLWCPLTNFSHVLVGHVLPITLLVAIGTLLGRKLLGLRTLPKMRD